MGVYGLEARLVVLESRHCVSPKHSLSPSYRVTKAATAATPTVRMPAIEAEWKAAPAG